jgi:glycopeptide antibiotics resistance protein
MAFRNQNPHLLLPLFPEESDRASDRAAFESDLNFPRDKTFVVTDHFLFSPQEWRLGLHDKEDLLLNIAGFVPFGFVLAALLRRRFGRGSTFILASFTGMLLSLLIETQQAWMPSRTSSLLDLILNTAGTVVGAICLLLLFGAQEEHSPETAESVSTESSAG